MRIGITGCAGMLGSHLSEILLSEGHEVIGIDNLDVGSYDNLIEIFENENFTFINLMQRKKI